MPEVAGNAAVLVDPYSVESITQGILQLTQNPKLADQLRTKGLQQIKKFSWQKATKKTLAVLKKV